MDCAAAIGNDFLHSAHDDYVNNRNENRTGISETKLTKCKIVQVGHAKRTKLPAF